MKKKIKLSKNLSHTWFFDLDGTILKHNGYIDDKKDTLLNGVKEFFKKIPPKDIIIITTSRDKKNSKKTINFLKKMKIRFDKIIFNLPYGERILLNDVKPKNSLKTAISINLKRNSGLSKYSL
jgi:predicted secreted acid phosphatase